MISGYNLKSCVNCLGDIDISKSFCPNCGQEIARGIGNIAHNYFVSAYYKSMDEKYKKGIIDLANRFIFDLDSFWGKFHNTNEIKAKAKAKAKDKVKAIPIPPDVFAERAGVNKKYLDEIKERKWAIESRSKQKPDTLNVTDFKIDKPAFEKNLSEATDTTLKVCGFEEKPRAGVSPDVITLNHPSKQLRFKFSPAENNETEDSIFDGYDFLEFSTDGASEEFLDYHNLVNTSGDNTKVKEKMGEPELYESLYADLKHLVKKVFKEIYLKD